MGSCAGVFYSFDRGSGTVRWRNNVSPDSGERQFHGDLLVAGDRVVIGTDAPEGTPGYLFAFRRGDGRLLWKLEAGSGVSSDVARRGSLGYALSMEDELLCFDLASGGVRWRFGTQAGRQGLRSSSPLLFGDRVYFVGLDQVAYALDADSGRVAWSTRLRSPATTWPVAAGGHMAFACQDGRIHFLDLASGVEREPRGIEGGPFNGPVLVAGDSLLVFLGASTVAAFDWRVGRLRWRRAAPGEWSSSRPYLWRGAVLAGDKAGDLMALELRDGRTRWTQRISGTVRGIGTSGDTLYVGTLRGRLHALLVAPRPGE